MSWKRNAEPGDVLVELDCPCETTPVLVLEAAAAEWTCSKRHTGTPLGRWQVRARVLDLDTYEPEGIDRLDPHPQLVAVSAPTTHRALGRGAETLTTTGDVL